MKDQKTRPSHLVALLCMTFLARFAPPLTLLGFVWLANEWYREAIGPIVPEKSDDSLRETPDTAWIVLLLSLGTSFAIIHFGKLFTLMSQQGPIVAMGTSIGIVGTAWAFVLLNRSRSSTLPGNS